MFVTFTEHCCGYLYKNKHIFLVCEIFITSVLSSTEFCVICNYLLSTVPKGVGAGPCDFSYEGDYQFVGQI